jgi:two-component system, cell cycle sensor histidine kinase and response regulator CckA
VVMPDKRGSAVAHAVREQRPDVKIVFMTGYSDGDLRAGAMPAGSHVVEKPFSPEALARKIRDVIDS